MSGISINWNNLSNPLQFSALPGESDRGQPHQFIQDSLEFSSASLSLQRELRIENPETGISVSASFSMELSAMSMTRVSSSTTYSNMRGDVFKNVNNRLDNIQQRLNHNSAKLFRSIGNGLLGKAGVSNGWGAMDMLSTFMQQSEALSSVGSKEMAEYLLLLQTVMGKDSKAVKQFMNQMNNGLTLTKHL